MNFLLAELQNARFRPAFEQLLNVISIPETTDVLANGPSEWWLDRGKGLESLDEFAVEADLLDDLARFLIALGDRHLDLVTPVADASISAEALPALTQIGVSRLRVHAVLESELSSQTVISIRVHRLRQLGLVDLVAAGMVSGAQLRKINSILDGRQNFLIAGPAGSGKTTLLRAMLQRQANLRTVVVEDSSEIVPVEGHVVGLQIRQPNTDGAGLIDLEALARQALRMRPDRVVVGEVRGAEFGVLLQAMNSGHRGSAATIHSNGSGQLMGRLQTLGHMAGYTSVGLEQAAKSAIQWVIHLELQNQQRKVTNIEEFTC